MKNFRGKQILHPIFKSIAVAFVLFGFILIIFDSSNSLLSQAIMLIIYGSALLTWRKGILIDFENSKVKVHTSFIWIRFGKFRDASEFPFHRIKTITKANFLYFFNICGVTIPTLVRK